LRSEVADELAFHVACRAEELQRSGMSEAEAECEALRRLGDPEKLLARCLRARRSPIGRLARAGAPVLLLGLAVSLVTPFLATLDVTLLRPAVRNSGSDLVIAWTEYVPTGTLQTVSRADFRDWRRALAGPGRPFESMALYASRPGNLRRSNEPARSVRVLLASADLPGTLGLRLAGEAGQPRTALPPGTALLTHATWRALFGDDADPARSRTVVIDGTRYEAARSLAPEARLPFAADVSIPLPAASDAKMDQLRGWRNFYAVGRLAPGAMQREVETAMRTEAARLGREHPLTNRYFSVRLRPYGDAVATLARGPLTAAGAGAALFLFVLVLCWRQYSSVPGRPGIAEYELALLLAVPMLLALWPLASGLADRLLSASVLGFTPMYESAFHVRLLVYYGIAALLGIIALTVPLARDLRRSHSVRGPHRASPRSHRFVESAATGAAALATSVLIVVAASAWGGVDGLKGRETGIDMRNLLLVSVALPDETYSSPRDRAEYLNKVVLRLAEERDAGIRGVGVAQATVGSGSLMNLTIDIEGGRGRPRGMVESVEVNLIGRRYLDVAGIPVLAGRTLMPADSGEHRAALISASTARRFFGGDAVGRVIHLGGNPAGIRIAGVVGDVRHASRRAMPEDVVYLPLGGLPGRSATILVRYSGDRVVAERQIRRVLGAIDRGVAVDQIRAGDDVLTSEIRQVRSPVLVLVAAAFLAVLLLVMRQASRTSSRDRLWIGITPIAFGIALGAWLGHELAGLVLEALELPFSSTSLSTYLLLLGLTAITGLIAWHSRSSDPATFDEAEPPFTSGSWTPIHSA
jgi:hypothetical protein